MKYWLLTTEYPPFFGGGISTYCYFTAKMLSDNGHAVSVFINDASVQDYSIETKGTIRTIRFNTSQTGSSSFLGHVTNISYEFAHILKEFIQKEGAPDIIEAQEYLGIAYYLFQYKYLLYEWCKEIPVVITMHSPSFLYMEYNHVPQYRYPNYWICEMERFCLQAADLLISPSQFMLTELGKRFELRNDNVRIIPNPFSSDDFDAVPLPENSTQNEIVFYGKLTVQKGAFKLLQYFKKMWDEGFSRPLYLLGGQDIVYHPEGKSMGDIIRRSYKKYIDIGLLKLEDRIKPSQIKERLARAEVVIVPSANDNLPYVVFEMMALGKVLLVSKQGGHSEVLEPGIDGFVFDHTIPGNFAQQLTAILAISQEAKRAIGQNAIKKVTTVYGLPAIYQQKKEAVEGVIATPKKDTAFPLIRPAYPELINDIPYKAGLLSIVVPYYNMGKYIDETVESLKQIDYPLKEILIINDGSDNEESIEKLKGYKKKDDIKIWDIPNMGLAHARNFGAQKAGGEFLAFLDADDKVAISYHSKAIRALKQYPNIQFAGAWTQYFDGSNKIWPTFSPEPPLILYHNMLNSSSLVYKRAAFLTAGKNDEAMTFQGLEDYDSVLSLLSHGFNGVTLPEPLFFYRIRSDSMIRSISKAKKLVLYEQISKKSQQLYATFAADIFNLLNANGPGIILDNPSLDYHLIDKIPFNSKLSGRLISLIKKNRYIKTIAYRAYRFMNK